MAYSTGDCLVVLVVVPGSDPVSLTLSGLQSTDPGSLFHSGHPG